MTGRERLAMTGKERVWNDGGESGVTGKERVWNDGERVE